MPVIEEVNVLRGRYTERQFQEAVRLTDYTGCLLVHYACRYNASVSVIQLLLDSDNGNNSIYKKNVMGWLPIHAACEQGFPHLDIVRLLISRDVEKKTLLVKDQRGRVPLYTACDECRSVEVIQLLLLAILVNGSSVCVQNNGNLACGNLLMT